MPGVLCCVLGEVTTGISDLLPGVVCCVLGEGTISDLLPGILCCVLGEGVLDVSLPLLELLQLVNQAGLLLIALNTVRTTALGYR